ncbi:MAG: hypothetical protein R3E66_18680 [bacterium]
MRRCVVILLLLVVACQSKNLGDGAFVVLLTRPPKASTSICDQRFLGQDCGVVARRSGVDRHRERLT